MNAQPAADLPRGLSQPALRALAGVGVTRLEQAAAFTEAELMALHGFGPKGLKLLRAALAERGLSLKP
ncbi:DNA-binding protein [bacterium]|nr:MAG: DNA-binding protein [bacterium]